MDFKIKMTKFLVTGSAGLVGTQLVKDLVENYEVYSGYNKTKPEFGISVHLDLTKKEEITSVLQTIKPDVVIHLGAITDVDLCEMEKEMAITVNTKATEILALESEKINAFFVYMSTDYVFDGKKGMKNEEDIPNPINFYGKSKLDGEIVLQKLTSPYVIIRISTPFGHHPKKVSFPLWIKQNIELKKEIPVVIDQYTSPSFIPHISKMIIEIISKKNTGIFHLSGSSRISRYEFAKLIVNNLGKEEKWLKPVKMDQMRWKAQRPQDSSLDISKANKILKNKSQKIEDSIKEFLSE
jgi:dTDP-4-dehydrorhamnose reductase